jgi:hypothetical protein
MDEAILLQLLQILATLLRTGIGGNAEFVRAFLVGGSTLFDFDKDMASLPTIRANPKSHI